MKQAALHPSNLIRVGIFGCPVGHSLSPVMHAAAAEAMGLSLSYVPYDIAPSRLGDAVASMRVLGMRGVNVTIPHKEQVMRWVDEVSATARAIGAANTLLCVEAGPAELGFVEAGFVEAGPAEADVTKRGGGASPREGADQEVMQALPCVQERSPHVPTKATGGDTRIIAHNTDAEGFVRSLHEAGFDPAGKRALIWGAGGAARAVAYGLVQAGARAVTVAARRRDQAEALCRTLNHRAETTHHAETVHHAERRHRLHGAEGATSAALAGATSRLRPATEGGAHASSVASDDIARAVDARAATAAGASGGPAVSVGSGSTKGNETKQTLTSGAPCMVDAVDWEGQRGAAEAADLLVQATGATLWKSPDGAEAARAFASSLPWDAFPVGAHVVDLVYKPRQTAVLAEAEKRGFATIDGLGMLVHQGALAFSLWTGQSPPTDVMRAALLRASALSSPIPSSG